MRGFLLLERKMKIIVTKLGTGSVGGKGRVDFYRGEEVVHTEEFVGMVQASNYTRLIDPPEHDRVEFINEDTTPFKARIEE